MLILDSERKAKVFLENIEIKICHLRLMMKRANVSKNLIPVWQTGFGPEDYIPAFEVQMPISLVENLTDAGLVKDGDCFAVNGCYYKALKTADGMSFAEIPLMTTQKEAESFFAFLGNDKLGLEVMPLKFLRKDATISDFSIKAKNYCPVWSIIAANKVIIKPVSPKVRLDELRVDDFDYAVVGEDFEIADALYELKHDPTNVHTSFVFERSVLKRHL